MTARTIAATILLASGLAAPASALACPPECDKHSRVDTREVIIKKGPHAQHRVEVRKPGPGHGVWVGPKDAGEKGKTYSFRVGPHGYGAIHIEGPHFSFDGPHGTHSFRIEGLEGLEKLRELKGLEGLEGMKDLHKLHKSLEGLKGLYELKLDGDAVHTHGKGTERRFYPGTGADSGESAHALFGLLFAGQPEGYAKPLKKNERQQLGDHDGKHHSSSRMTIIHDDGKHKYEITVKDDEVSAKVDGEPVDDDRIKMADGKVTILDEQGDVVAQFQVGLGVPGGAFGFGKELEGIDPEEFMKRFGEGRLEFVPDMHVSHPPVMLGVTMSDAQEAVLAYLGVEPPKGVRIDKVIEGLPAADAGLEPGDIVVAVNGKPGVSQEQLRGILQEKEAGDVLELKIARKGDFKMLKVKLAAWDGEKLGVAGPQSFQFRGPGDVQRFWREGNRWFGGEPKKAIEDVMKQLEEALGDLDEEDIEQYKKQARKAIEEALKQLENSDVLKRFEQLGPQWYRLAPDVDQWMELQGEKPGQRFRVPVPAPDAPQVQADDDIEDRIDDLEDRLDRIEALLRKLADDR